MASRSLSTFVVCGLLLACSAPPAPPPPSPGPLRGAMATRLLDLPVGVSMGGYLRARTSADPGSPWARQLPASRGVHAEPTARVLVLTNGVTRLAMVRLDTAITSPSLRSRVLGLLAAEGEGDTRLLLYASHTHAGPARFMPPARLGSSTGTDFVSLVMDHQDAEVEARLARTIADAAHDAFAHLEPLSVGVATVEAGDFNSDRRCENDLLYGKDFRDTAMTVIRLDVVGDDAMPVRPFAALLHYAVHGTVLGSENTLFSTEAPGALELYASDLLGIPAMFVQGAAGDVSPRGDSFQHGDLQLLERQGRAAAVLAAEAFARAAPGPAPAQARLDYLERGVLVSREAIGYAQGEFPEGGGLQCSAGGQGACGAVVSTPGEVLCLPLERRKPTRTTVSLLRLGDELAFLTMPGEPGTGLSRKLQAALAPLGARHALVVGYAQDHFGYLLEADDWLRGGYEPTVSAWGWKFGPYLLAEVEAFVATIGERQPAPDLLAPLDGGAPRPVSASLRAPLIVTEPESGERLGTHLLAFEGGDPALGLPRVSLERRDGAGFSPVLASPTRPVVNGPELLLRYDATPTFRAEPEATSRTHLWTVQFETLPSTPLGQYRLVARGSARAAAGEPQPYELVSAAFEVKASTAVSGRARLTADGRLALSGRFPPNPTLFAPGRDDVIGNYRVRDMDASPTDGARARGASGSTVEASLRAPDGTTQAATLAWSDAEDAFVSAPLTTPGAWSVDVAPGALRDRDDNRNGLAFTAGATR
jgi:neutral ceramidase